MPTFTGTNNSDTINGTAGDDIIYGLGGDDFLHGNDGNDILDGGTGGDDLYGGLGDDTYYVDSWNEKIFIQDSDFIFEYAGEGNDRVATSVSYRAQGEVERVEAVNFTDTSGIYLYGTDYNQTIIGNAGNNLLLGLGGDDVIIGGAGEDVMYGDFTGSGPTGNDTFYVDNLHDRVFEYSNSGSDRVLTTVDFTIETEVERLEALDPSGTTPLALRGNEIAQTIIGNAGANVLHGAAGDDKLQGLAGDDYIYGDEGSDSLQGGLGNDTYYVDSGDTVVEAAGEGADRVAAMTSFFLTANASVEVLEAVDLAGTARLDLGGSDSANVITGNAGTNFLYGQGGDDILNGLGGDDFLIGGSAGSTDHDQMFGGAGNDTYYVFSSGDTVSEAVGQGNDRIATKVSLELSGVSEVEILEAGDSTATTALVLTGSDFGNHIAGNAGNNVLNGRGGNDLLTGYGGADTFAFSTAPGANNVDAIEDFVHGTDRIALDDAIFAGIGSPGAFNANAFVVGTAAGDADDRIIYNSTTGQLFYDADGTGSGAAVQFATLLGTPVLSATDFQVI